MAYPTEPCEILYLPHAQTHRAFPWELFHRTHRMGAFATQDECFRHALRLAQSMGYSMGRDVRLRIEDEGGGWSNVAGYEVKTASPSRPRGAKLPSPSHRTRA